MVDIGGAYRVLVGKPEGRRLFGNPITDGRDLREVGWWGGGMEWIIVAQDGDRWRDLCFDALFFQLQ
jgi:hypothetical protein